MKSLMIAAGLGALVFAIGPVYSQTPSPSTPAAGTKRADCRVSAKSAQGDKQDKLDQYQICLAQARLECLKEAIAKKVVVRDQRRDYIKNCVGSRDEDSM